MTSFIFLLIIVFAIFYFLKRSKLKKNEIKPKPDNNIKSEISDEERNIKFQDYQINYIEKNNFKRLKVFQLAGSNHYLANKFLKENDIINLVHESENTYDKRAIGAYSEYGKIGHIATDDLDYTHDLLLKGCNKAHISSVKIYESKNYPNKIFVKVCVPFPYKSK